MKTKIFTLFTALTLGAGTLFAAFPTAAVDDIYYTFYTEVASVVSGPSTSYGNYRGDVVIPESVTYNDKTYPVTRIETAFKGCSKLTSVTLPNSIISLYDYSFSGCSELTSVTIPNSVQNIGKHVFDGCSSLTSVVWNAKNCVDISISSSMGDVPFDGASQMTSFTFGDEVEHIPAYLCYGLSKLTSVTIPNSVTSIGKNVFNGCSSLTSVVWNAKNCADVSSESYAPFYNIRAQITSFTFGDEVEHIPAYLCDGMSNLTSVTIPNSVTSIGSNAFDGCSGLTTTNYTDNIAGWCGITFKNQGSNPTTYTHNLYINDVEVIDLVIPDGVANIKNYAFYGCSGLTSVTIPNSVTSIGEQVFFNCSSLTSVTIPNSVESIGNSAFIDCTELRAVTLSNSCKTIGVSAFANCKRLIEINSPAERVPDIEELTFAGVSTTAMVRVPCGSVELYKASNYWNVFSNISGADRFNYSFKSNNEKSGTVVIVKEPTCTDWTATIHAYPYQGYEFLGWSDGVQDNPRTILVNGDMALTALFSGDNVKIDVMANNDAYGSITGGGIYPIDETITLTATPNAGYYFVQWSDGSKDNPRQVVVTQNSTFTAEFALKQFAITTSAENGAVTGAGTYAYGTQVELKATPNAGYYFVQWSDGNKDNLRQVVVTQDSTFTAEFALQQFTVSTEAENGTVTGAGTYAYGTQVELTAT
ncbi:MAG: leucine-rich repeat protein, partial [Paludibacteraceae bacterium]